MTTPTERCSPLSPLEHLLSVPSGSNDQELPTDRVRFPRGMAT